MTAPPAHAPTSSTNTRPISTHPRITRPPIPLLTYPSRRPLGLLAQSARAHVSPPWASVVVLPQDPVPTTVYGGCELVPHPASAGGAGLDQIRARPRGVLGGDRQPLSEGARAQPTAGIAPPPRRGAPAAGHPFDVP